VLEEGSETLAYNVGELDTLTIKLSKSKEQDKFIIIPSEKEIEEKIREQVLVSFKIAVGYVKKIVRRVSDFHEVIIQFDKRVGFYIGSSLGLALTVGFIEKLLQYYNAAELVTIKSNIALTGGVDKEGTIIACSAEIIKQKVETVFFSNCNIFVVPKEDEAEAKAKAEELKKEFPNRRLELIGIESLSDLLNRRNLIDIKKQNPVVRTAKFTRKNWITVSLTLILLLVLTFIALRDLDNNPALLGSDTSTLYVKNKNGKILWTKKHPNPLLYIGDERIMGHSQKLIDINSDGKNELLLAGSHTANMNDGNKFSSIICYDHNGRELWYYQFKDNVYSKRENLSSVYSGSYIIDTITFNGKKVLLLMVSNYESFSSAVFMIELSSGKRIGSTLWHSGHIQEGILADIDEDNRLDLIFTAINNGYEKVVLAVVDLDFMKGVSPTTDEYQIIGKEMAKFKAYLVFPKSDYNQYLMFRNNSLLVGSLIDFKRKNKISFRCTEDNKIDGFIIYDMSYDFKDAEITISSTLRVKRDSLVAKGILSLPLTDTEEFKNLLKSQILYWSGEKLVKREELK
ncbi:MAG: hypothetical protein KJ666_11780, partial [Bacteroidetes bacterium]|nr:hypothetical protein [Bacteroidota bacterium]